MEKSASVVDAGSLTGRPKQCPVRESYWRDPTTGVYIVKRPVPQSSTYMASPNSGELARKNVGSMYGLMYGQGPFTMWPSVVGSPQH